MSAATGDNAMAFCSESVKTFEERLLEFIPSYLFFFLSTGNIQLLLICVSAEEEQKCVAYKDLGVDFLIIFKCVLSIFCHLVGI